MGFTSAEAPELCGATEMAEDDTDFGVEASGFF